MMKLAHGSLLSLVLLAGCGDPYLPTIDVEASEEAIVPGVIQAGREFACTGTSVPGDYETLQEAADALSATGGIICVAPGSHGENGDSVVIQLKNAPLLRITGASAATTAIDVKVSIRTANGSNGSGDGVLLEGLDFRRGLVLSADQPMTVRACKAYSSPSAISVVRTNNSSTPVLIDACAIRGDDVGIAVNAAGMVTITNSYIEYSRSGMKLMGAGNLVVAGNSIRASDRGVSRSSTGTTRFHDNVVIGASVAVEASGASGPYFTHSHNGYSNNVQNFSGTSASLGNVIGNLEINSASPPVPGPFSPLRGAGVTLADVPSLGHDFFFRPRPQNGIDIGAVQTDLAPARPVISQVAYDTPGPDSLEEFIELYNRGDVAINLSGWQLRDNDTTFALPTGSMLAPHTFLTIARDAAGYAGWLGAQPDIAGSPISLGNAGDSVSLYDATGTLRDFVQWEGDVSPLVAETGQVLLRTNPAVDTDTNADWAASAPIVR